MALYAHRCLCILGLRVDRSRREGPGANTCHINKEVSKWTLVASETPEPVSSRSLCMHTRLRALLDCVGFLWTLTSKRAALARACREVHQHPSAAEDMRAFDPGDQTSMLFRICSIHMQGVARGAQGVPIVPRRHVRLGATLTKLNCAAHSSLPFLRWARGHVPRMPGLNICGRGSMYNAERSLPVVRIVSPSYCADMAGLEPL